MSAHLVRKNVFLLTLPAIPLIAVAPAISIPGSRERDEKHYELSNDNSFMSFIIAKGDRPMSNIKIYSLPT
jgi:hypothetical protein